ncbi:microtubule-actin cross-linking factor 1, isoforms 1/2/3/4/5-like isoform X1 [Gadus chalcogrammus]|uniref:microtubule-actin cross-linking factor 1, isoforms 1/2/3/4/5-like isoform X1 n=1 Tax=Gadus chalcogrammus TaxID=1042646 RepID=UPI0024C47723|nr:microtubule-actin cross-linking factor 1, isoforms 1/2/3/4/5-like isoform X1 [Gadus chalcogrammus]
MESSDEETLSERSYVSGRSLRSERSGGSLSPCPSGPQGGPAGSTLPWNLAKHERRKRKSQDSVLDPAERAVVRVADERDRVQKKTFTKWVNKHLIKVRKHITDLYEDLRDGHNLISLLEVLSGVTLQLKSGPVSTRAYVSRAPPPILIAGEDEEQEGAQGPREKGRMRFHRLQNVQIALDFLKQRQVKLVNIRNDDITDGNPKLTLGLIWTIILHFQISEIYVSGESGDLTAKEKLLLWTQQATEGYPGLRCSNFTSSWSNGRLFNALLHRYRPDLIDMEVVTHQSNRDNLEQAFEIAESLGVTRLLDAEDVDVPSPDEKSVITYVASIYDAFPKIPEGGEGIPAHEVDQRWSEYQTRFSSLMQWSRKHTALMADKNFPQNPVELKALYNQYIHFKETEIPIKEMEKSRVEHLYKLLEVWIEFGRIKLPQGIHPNELEVEWGKLILEMLDREKALRPAVDRVELLLQMANKIQNTALDCEEKLTLAKNTLQADMSRMESGEGVQCEGELACYLQDCEGLIRQLNQDVRGLREERYYQVDQLASRVSGLQEELVSLRLQCSSVYRKGHFSSQSLLEQTAPRPADRGLSLGQTLLGAVGAVGAALLRRPMARSQLVAMSSSEDEGSLRFIYELLGWVEETQDLLEGAEWGADLPSVENNLQEHNEIHTAVQELLSSIQEARNYQGKVSPNFKNSYCETMAKLEHQYCKLLERSSWRLRSLESLHGFVTRCTEELIWLNEREEEEMAYDWGHGNTSLDTKRELYTEMRSELDEKQDMMQVLQETADRLCQENHPAKQTVEAYSAALQTQWQWVRQLCVCVEQHLKDNAAYFQFMNEVRDCESYLRQLQDTIKRQYTCDRNSRLGKLEDLLQDSMEEKEQLIEYRRSVASLVGRAKAVVQLRPRSTDTPLGAATPIRAICDYRQIEITISRGEECVLEDNSQRTKWKVISPSGNEAMVPSVCFTVPPPNQEAIDTASRMEQMYQKVMSLWHQLHMNMKSVVSWHYLTKDLRTVSAWSLDTMRSQSPPERDQALDELESHLADFLSDSKESALFTPAERSDLEKEAQQAQKHCQDLLLNMETVEKDESVSRSYLSELRDISLHLEDVERRLTRAIQTPPLSHLSGDGADGTARITEQEKMQAELEALQSSVGEVSRRCVGFFQDKPTSSSVPAMRSELSQAVEKMDKLYNLSHVFLQKLKTVDVLMSRLGDTEEVVRKYESRLSDEDTVPADTTAMQVLQEQLASWQGELSAQDGVLRSLQAEVERAREAGSQLARLHPDRSSELERYQERANQMAERWSNVERQMETRRADLEVLGSSLQQYKDGHSGLISWIEETTERQENTQPGQMDSKALSEQLAQQTALVVEIEANQTKLDQCQINAKQYCTSVKDYELQLMTYRAFVESTHKSSLKRRRMHSSSDAISQEFMDLRTRYTALVTLTTQHVKYISDALRRIEEEEKEVEEEMQARVGPVSDLLGWVKGLQGRSLGPNAESSLAAQQAVTEQLSARKEEVAEAIRSTQVFLQSKQASKLSPEESARVRAQLEELTSTYSQLCDSSSQQLQKMEHQLAKEEEEKKQTVIAGIIDMGSMEIFSVFSAAQCGLIDQETCRFLLEAQLISGGLLQPPSPQSLSLEHALAQGMIDNHTSQSLSYLERALHLVNETKSKEGEKQCLLPVAIALEEGVISEHLGLHILEVHMNTGGLRYPSGELVDLDTALDQGLLPSRIYIKLQSQLQCRELIDPNTAERLSLSELQQRCISHEESGLHLLPVKQQSERTVSLRSGRKVGIFRASQEGLVDQNVTVRLLEAQLFAGGIVDPRSGHRLILDEALSQGLMHQDQACTILARQLQTGGILDPRSGERLGLDESLCRDLLSPSLALLVLESLQSFMGMLWPESGELVPIAEALQQGGVSEDLARNVLGQRHVVGALYDVGALHLVPLSQTSEKALDLSVAKVLSKIHIPDVLPSTPSSPPSTNRISWCSTSSSPSPSSQPPASLTTGHVWDSTPMDSSETQEQAKHVLLSHLMTHSYVDVHSGKRLVLLDAELVELVKATGLSCADTSPGYQVQEEGSSLIAGSMQTIGSIRTLVYSAEGEKEETAEVVKTSCQAIPKVVLSSEIIERKGRTSQESKNGVGDRALQQTSNQKIEPAIGGKGEKKIENVTAKGEIEIAPRSENSAGKPLSQQVNKSDQHKVRNKEGSSPSKQADTSPSINQDNATSSVVNTERVYAELEQDLAIVESSKTIDSAGSQAVRSMGYAQIVQKSDFDYKSQFINRSSETNKTEEEAEMERLTIELKQGGLLTEEGDRLLPDEAVAQGILPGQTAVKLMSQAGLFGGFLDATSGELLSLEDVMQEDLLDEDLMWSVLKSDKSLSGVVDIDKGNVCGLREAAQKGLIDSNTASRLLEAQVLSGGIVDLNRDEKVSVTLAANLGLIEEDQKESLEALENAYKGKATEPQTAIAKATIQLQMEGIVDPESRSPVPLECAIQKGLIGSEEAYQALSKQVAEGGILHHASGTRLSVSDALERGLVDRSLAPGLEELQCVYKGNISLLAHPEAALFQASTGAIYSPESGRKLTLTEAVSKGLLEEKVAKEAMASDSVTQGVIDPQSCRIVPYSHLVHQGKIDLNTGKRFLEVKQFRGIQDEQTGDILTLKQAIAIGKVDPVPALRLLQSQADSGGIIDVTSGDRLPLPEASEKGLIEEDMAREIAINQITKGGLIHPTTGQRVANLDDAIIAGLISSEMAFDIQESMTLADIDEGEGSSTPMVSSNSAYSPGADSSVASNQVKWSSESSLSTSPLLEQSGIGLVFKEVDQKQLDSLTSNQLSLCDATLEEDTVEQPLSESDSSIDLLAKFASNVGKRIQQAINEIKPQKAELKQGPGEASSIRERHAVGTRKESDYTGITAVSSYQESDPETLQVAEQVTITRSVDLSVRADKKKTRPADVRVLSEHHEDENDERIKDAKADDVREEGKLKESLGVDVLSLKQLEHEYTEQCDEAGKREIGGELEDTAETILTGEGTDVKHSDQSLTASDKEAEAKSKKKKKSKKKGRGKESENKPLPLEKSDNVSDIKQMDSENEGQSQVTKSITGVSPLPVKVKILESTPERDLHVKDGELKIDGKVDAAEVSLVSQDDQQANDNGGQPDISRAEIVRKQMEECVDKQYGKTEMGVSVQKGAKRPEKSNLPDNEKAALILKAKESILKKVFEKGVTEKQAAEELEALRKEVHRKDIQAGNARDGKMQTPVIKMETPSRKMATPLTKMVDVEGSTDEDDHRKMPDAKPKVEWKGETGGRKENLKVDVREVVVVDEPNTTDDSSLALKEVKTVSKENDDCVGDIKEGKDKETVSPDQHNETPLRKMVTPLTEMVDVEGSTDEDDLRKPPDAKTKLEWKGETGGRKEENLKVDVKEVVVVDEPNLTDDSSLALKEAKTVSKEKDDCVGGVKEGKDKESVSPDQHEETPSRKMVTPLTEMVDVEVSTDEDDLRKRPDAKTKVEWMGETGGRKEENLKVDVKEVVVVDEPNLTDDSSLALKEAKTVSKEKDDCVGGVKEGKDKETVSPDKHKETPSRKMVTPLTEMVNVEGSTDEDDLRKWPDAKPKVEWMGKTGGRKEENLKVDVKEALVVAEPKITDDSSLAIKEAKTLSKEADDRVSGVKEGKQTVSPDQHKETRQGKRHKKNKKSKIAKIAGHADAATEKPWTDDAVQAVVTATICTKKTGINVERKADDQKGESLKYVKSESDVDRPSSSDDTNKMASSTVDAKTTNEVLQRPIRASAPAIEKEKAEVKSAREEFKGPLKVIESKSVEEIKEALQMTGKQSAGDEFKRSLHSSVIKSGGEEVKEHVQKYVSDTVREEMKDPLKMGGINSTEEKLKEALQMTVVKEMKEPVHIAEIKSATEEMKGPLGLTGNQSAGEEVKKHVQKTGIDSVGEEIKEPIPLAGMTSIGKELKEHQLNIKEQLHPAIPSIAADVFGTTYEAVDNESYLQPDSRSVDSMKQDPNLVESPLPSQTGNKPHPGSLLPSEENPTESELAEVLETDTTTESSGEGEEDKEEIKMKKKKGSAKSSLIRQECLEHDQRIVALVSMVRHIEVCLKQQQQQSVGRGLISLEDIIRQTEALSLELQDLEPEVNKEVEATAQLLEPRPSNVPPQLLLALEKDMRSLARGYESARGVSATILQGLREHRDSYKEAVTAEQKNLGGLVENLLTWLSETEARSIGAMAGKEEKDSPVDQITQQLEYCKEFQAALTARSNEVIDAAFDVQVFISERAQDLAPEQSRHLLGQLQRLQGAFHQASGQARARAETLSNQRAREEELQQKESAKVQEEEKEREIERQTARKIEVWMHADEFIDMNACLECVFLSPLCFAHERMSAFCFTIHNLLLVTVFII